MSSARPHLIAVVASAPSHCAICRGDRVVEVRAIPDGAWKKTRCPHCNPGEEVIALQAPVLGVPIYLSPKTWRNARGGGAA